MFNSTATSYDFNTAALEFNRLQEVESNAKAVYFATDFTDPNFQANCTAYNDAETERKWFWYEVFGPMCAQTEPQPAASAHKVGEIAGSELSYSEVKENVVQTLQILWNEKWLDHCELAWLDRWLAAANRFPSLIGYLTPFLQAMRDVFYVADALVNDDTLRWIAEYQVEAVSDRWDGLNNAASAVHNELSRRGIGKLGRTFFDRLDVETLFSL